MLLNDLWIWSLQGEVFIDLGVSLTIGRRRQYIFNSSIYDICMRWFSELIFGNGMAYEDGPSSSVVCVTFR